MPRQINPPMAKIRPGEALISWAPSSLLSTTMLASPVTPNINSLYPR